jgi:hypothetical protein
LSQIAFTVFPRELRMALGRRPVVYFNRYLAPPRLVTPLVWT